MKRKIRVVSIILCTAILIGLLPAEQVFASGTTIGIADQLGIEGHDWSLYMVEGSTPAMYVQGEDLPAGSFTEKLKPKGKDDSVGTIINNAKEGLTTIKGTSGSNHVTGYYLSNKYTVSNNMWHLPETASSGNLDMELFSKVLTTKVMCAESDEEYSLSDLTSAGECIYLYKYMWHQGNNEDKIFENKNDSWLYQVVFCNYLPEKDMFAYGSMCYVQEQGGNDIFVCTAKLSYDLKFYGIITSKEDDGKKTDFYKNIYGTFDECITSWLKSKERDVQIYNAISRCMNYDITEGDPNSSDGSLVISKEPDSDFYSLTTAENLAPLGLALSSMTNVDSYFTYLPGGTRVDALDIECNSSAILNVYRLRKIGSEGIVYEVHANAEMIMQDLKVTSDDVAGSISRSGESAVTTNDIFTKVKDSVDVGVYAYTVKEQTITFGEYLVRDVTSIGSGGSVWSVLFTDAISAYNILSEYKDSSDIKINYVAKPGYIDGFYNLATDVGTSIKFEDFRSDTGSGVAKSLSALVEKGGITVVANASGGSTYFDWREFAESGKTTIDVSSAYDLMYVIAYIDYLSTLKDGLPLEFTHIKVKIGDRCYNLFPDESDLEVSYRGRWLDKEGNIAANEEAYVEYFDNLLAVSVGTYGCNEFVEDVFALYNISYTEYMTILSRLKDTSRILTEGWDTRPFFSSSFASGGTSVVTIDSAYTSEQMEELRATINNLTGSFMYTGTAMNCLSYSYHNYLYAYLKGRGVVGENTVEAIDEFAIFTEFGRKAYSRASRLSDTIYAGEVGSNIDYLPRLPLVRQELTAPEKILLYNVDYGLSIIDWSTYALEEGTSATDIRNWMEDTGEADRVLRVILDSIGDEATLMTWANSGVYDNIPENYLNVFKIIISTYNLCGQLAVLNGDITIDEWMLQFDYNPNSAEDEELKDTYEKVKRAVENVAKNWSGSVYRFVRLYIDKDDFFRAVNRNLVHYIAEDFSYSTPIEPLGFVIKFEDEQLSAQWKYGYALSSMYVPFQTNVYEVAAIEEKADDAEWVTNFYYKYGFYRKALYITTDPDAVVNRYTAGIQSGTKVATLRDLLNYNRDIELYIDQGFYNGDLLEEQLDRFIQNTNEGSVFGSIYDACNLTPDAILKDGGYATYSSAIQAKVRPFGYEIAEAEKEEAAKMFAYEDFILSEDEILGEDGMLSAYEYSIQQPYGLVSAMYRSGTLFNKANQASVQNEPVFVSSKNANAIGSYNKDLYRSFYNYLMLSAMEETIERETTLLVDLDAPIFIDIFGNILTSDGYVIIPAAANPTLVGEDWVPYTLGFATYVNNADPSVFKNMTYEFYDFLYGINYAAAIGKSDIDTYSPNFRDNQKKIGGGYFFLRQNGTSTLGTTNLTDGVASTTVNWDNPNTHVAALKNLLFSVHYLNTADMYSMTTVNMILEVLRGAPIEFIDFANEGITATHALTKGGATVAYMSEQLLNSVQTDSNGTERNAKFSATLNVLDLFHIESAEKVALLAVKLLLIGFLILLAVQIIADASVGKMPVKTVGRIIVTCVLTGTCISLLPVLTEFSLSKLTQMFLQPEAAELLAMQAQRDSYGIEIGITESYNTESSTDIIVKVGELDVQWYDLLLYSVYSSIDDSFTDLYAEAADGLPLAEASYTFTSGKNIYMDLGKIMDSTVVQYNGELGLITNERTREMSDDDMSASYLFPYYVFLDQLVANVNLYNKTNGVQPLSYNINSDGSIRTQDMTYAYFHSTEFMTTDYDILDLYRILNINTYKLSYCPYFSDDDLVTMGGSLWYPTNTDTDTLTASVELLYQSARDYVANNSSMLSYVSDGAFLKSLAMYLAVEYNSIFGVGTADAFELKCVDTKDMLRYVVSHPKDVYKYATRSFSRYAFEVGDVWGAILATALYVIMCVTNAIKVVAYVLTYVTAVWSIIYHRVFKRESDYSVYGFFILIGEITILNVIYSASLKVMMNLTRWGMPGLAALGVSILLQGGIIIGFLLLCFNGVKNVKNLGQKEIHRIQTIINNLNRDRSSSTNDNPNQPERTVAVLQAHDFSRRELDNYNGDRANVADLLAHDRRREMGQIGQEATES